MGSFRLTGFCDLELTHEFYPIGAQHQIIFSLVQDLAFAFVTLLGVKNFRFKKKKSLIVLYKNYFSNYHFFPKTNFKICTGSQQCYLKMFLSPGLTEDSFVDLSLLDIFLFLHCPNWRTKSNNFIVFWSVSSGKTMSPMKSFLSSGFQSQIFAKCTASFLACAYSIQDFQVVPLSNYPPIWA